MRFLVDECTGPKVAAWLREQGHDVFSVYDEARGMKDQAILQQADSENRILITNDKDFGELVSRDQCAHRGVILIRIDDERSGNKITVLRKLLNNYADRLADEFVVVTDTRIRFIRSPGGG